MSTAISREDAEIRARNLFYVHAGVYVGVNAFLAYTNLTNNPDRLWFYWPLAGWGAGLVAHAAAVFVTHKAADRVQQRVARRAERQEMREERREERAARRDARS